MHLSRCMADAAAWCGADVYVRLRDDDRIYVIEAPRPERLELAIEMVKEWKNEAA